MSAPTPAAWPLIRSASTPRYSAAGARSATVRPPTDRLNSGVMFPNSATSSAPIACR